MLVKQKRGCVISQDNELGTFTLFGGVTVCSGRVFCQILFTLHPSLATPDKQGVWRGEEFQKLFTTLHLSSPIRGHLKKINSMKNCTRNGASVRWWPKKVLISLWSRRDKLICLSNSSRNRRLGNWICRMPPLWLLLRNRWRVVKSWAYSSPRQTPCLSGGARGWVKSEEYFMTPLFIKFSESRIPGGGLVLLSLMAGFTMPYGQPTSRYEDSWLF